MEIHTVLTTGREELDRVIGGIPIPSMNLIEGENASGKSVLAQHIAYGAVRAGIGVRYITTENTVRSLVDQMDDLGLDVWRYMLRGLFRITAMQVKGIRWDRNIAKYYLNSLKFFISKRGAAELVVIDSLTYAITHAREKDVLAFFSDLRNMVDKDGRTFVITVHPNALTESMLIRIRSICDGNIRLRVQAVPGREIIRVLEVSKLRGASRPSKGLAVFKVVPGFGIKVVPFSQVKV